VIFQQEFALLPGKPDFIKASIAWKVGFYTHAIFGGLGLLTGWTQFIPKIRATKLKLHRQTGKIYVVSVFVSSIAGIGVGVFATGGMIAAAGFIILGVVWFYTTYKAYTTILTGDVVKHEMWMIYSYSACFSAVTLRVWMPVTGLIFEEFVTGYRIVAWLCWLPNILVASLIIKSKNMKKYLRNASLVLLSALFIFSSCKKENNNTGGNSRVVKYEITGNFSGKLTVIYNDNVNGNTVVNNVVLPYLKGITYPANITGIGIAAQASIPGAAGQTATMKIYSGGNVVKTVSATAGSLGELVLPTVAYTF
jgi:hypothetical protein